MIEVVTEGEDAEEFAELQQLLPLPLVHPRIGFCIGTNIVKVVMDASKFSMIVTHDTEMDPEGEQQYKASCVSGKEGVASAPPPPAAESSAASAAGSTGKGVVVCTSVRAMHAGDIVFVPVISCCSCGRRL